MKNTLIKDKTILVLSISVFIYLTFLLLSYQLKLDSIVIIGVLREMLDIPAFILLPFLFVLACISFIKRGFKFNSLPFYSMVILLAITIALILIL